MNDENRMTKEARMTKDKQDSSSSEQSSLIRHSSFVIRHSAVAALLFLPSCLVGPNFKKPAAPDVSGYTTTPLSTTSATANVAGGEAQHFARKIDIYRFALRIPCMACRARQQKPGNPEKKSVFHTGAAATAGAGFLSWPRKITWSAGTTISSMIGPTSMPPTITVASGRCT